MARSQPRAQTLSTPIRQSRHSPGFVPRYTLRVGDAVGEDLAVIGLLNSGSTSELYQVWSRTYICALTCKIMRPGFKPRSREALAFRREGMLLGRLQHPQIVRIFHCGTFHDREYLVQEYLHGPSLLELLEQSPHRRMPVPDVVKTAIHLASALDHLHAAGYLYRDMKPSNIMLRGRIPILLDFDSAWRWRPGRRPARAVGTDPYMAPEQCRRAGLRPAADIYGLGALMYEALTGRWPFEKEIVGRAEDDTRPEARFPQLTGRMPPAPERFNRAVPRELSAIVRKCLAPNPSDRYSSARELVRSLVPLLRGSDRILPNDPEFKPERIA
jgi:serine/threonine protein kinase